VEELLPMVCLVDFVLTLQKSAYSQASIVKYNVCTEEAGYIMGMILQALLGSKLTSEVVMWLMNTVPSPEADARSFCSQFCFSEEM
jgi:hypothetical protein